MPNPYLARLRAQAESLRTAIEGLQARAAQENRDLTEVELRSVTEQGEQYAALAGQIELLTTHEEQHRAVAAAAARVADDQRDEHNREGGTGGDTGHQRVGGAQTRDRDPGHYRQDGAHSFFGDLFAARSLQDETALQRLVEHNRALDMATEGPGVVPPVWMTSEFQTLARQQRRAANAVRNLPLANAAPMSLPRQTGGSGIAGAGPVAEQSAENAATSFADKWGSAVDTVAPRATSGGQAVSRQMLDSSNPAVDALIYGDLVADYNTQVEAKVVAAMLASATAAPGSPFATGAAWADEAVGPDSILDAALAVRIGRKLPADILVANVARYGSVLKWKDSTGRPLVPAGSAGPSNVLGRGDVATDGFLDSASLSILATDGVPATFPENILVARAADVILFESPVLRFRYEEPQGPETIRLGIWAYTATYVKYAGLSVKRITLTAA